ncbi:MAG: hypothetical protein IPP60_11885 [Sphingobacteriales bacterium]|nr:hypothetical protein [Sphingobacteriales bacterium]
MVKISAGRCPNLSAVDYALRGYVVAYYENVAVWLHVLIKKKQRYFTNKIINQCND